MHSTFSISALMVASLTATGLAAPTAAPATDPDNVLPMNMKSQCASKGIPGAIRWGVYVANTTMPSDGHSGSWGGGLLDNINGQVGCAPTNWQAQLDNPPAGVPQGVGVTFNTPLTCTQNKISNAIHAASGETDDKKYIQGQWVYCSGDTMSEFFDQAGQLIKMYEEYLGTVAELFSDFAKK